MRHVCPNKRQLPGRSDSAAISILQFQPDGHFYQHPLPF